MQSSGTKHNLNTSITDKSLALCHKKSICKCFSKNQLNNHYSLITSELKSCKNTLLLANPLLAH